MLTTLRSGWRPGVIGDVARAHGVYYARAWGLGVAFEAKVSRELGEFFDRYDPALDLLLTVESDGAFLGGITIDGSDPELRPFEAHLRWFIIGDAGQGSGIGGRLLAAAMDFLSTAGHRRCYLTTFKGLDAARHLYERHGFRLTEEALANTWGVALTEQRFDFERD